MHLAHRGNYSHARMHQVANLLDVAHLLGPHLHYKHLMVRLQTLPYGPNHTHRGVEITRSHQDIILFAQNAIEIILSAGLSETSRHSYDYQPLMLGQFLRGIVIIPSRHSLFHRTGQSCRHHHHEWTEDCPGQCRPRAQKT